MNGHEVKQRAQTAKEMTEEINRATEAMAGFDGGLGAVGEKLSAADGGLGAADGGLNAADGGLNVANGELSAGRGLDGTGRGGIDLAQARGIGGLAMGQVLTYNPEAIQGRDANQMAGVAGQSLGELERPSAFAQAENERVRETAELDSGYARNEIAPNLSSVGLATAVEQAEYQATDRANANAEFKPMTFEDEIQNATQEEVGKAMAVRVGKALKQKSFRPNDVVEWRDKGMLEMFERFKNKRVFKERNG